MKTIPWNERKFFGALDWASDHHDLVVVDKTAQLFAKCALNTPRQAGKACTNDLLNFSPFPLELKPIKGWLSSN
jgi:hypothetical protein